MKKCPNCGEVLERVNVEKHTLREGKYDGNDHLIVDETAIVPNSEWIEVFCPNCGALIETVYLD